MVAASHHLFCQKTQPTLTCSRELGNLYCGSLFSGLISLICGTRPGNDLVSLRYVVNIRLAKGVFCLHMALDIALQCLN